MNLSMSLLERLVPQGNSTSAYNCPNFLPLLIFEKKLRQTSKNFKFFRNTLTLFFRLTQMDMDSFLSGLSTRGFRLRINPIQS